MNNETNQSAASNTTTFSTWGRVAEQQMAHLGEVFAEGTKLQTSAMEQGKELLAYNMKLAREWQDWASEARRSIMESFSSAK